MWDVMFISEFDAFLDEKNHFSSNWEVYRHWPGTGSFSVGFILAKRASTILQNLWWYGRVGAVHLKYWDSNNRQSLDFFIVGVHGAHGNNFPEFLLDVSSILMHKPRLSKLIMVGDWNVDILHTCTGLPPVLMSELTGVRAENYGVFIAFLSSLNLVLNIPKPSTVASGGRYGSLSTIWPISRIPRGALENEHRPSCLDFCVSSPGAVEDSRLSWKRSTSDHAFQWTYTCGAMPPIRHAPTTWRPEAVDRCIEWAATHAPHDVDTLEDFHQHVHAMMDANVDKRPRSQRRREPRQIQCEFARVAASSDSVSRSAHMRSARAAQVHHRRRETEVRVQRDAQRGKAIQKISPLHPVRGVILSSPVAGAALAGQKSSDREWWRKEVQACFGKKWGCRDLARRSIMFELFDKYGTVEFNFTYQQVQSAIDRIKRSKRLDYLGISSEAMCYFAAGAPGLVAKALRLLFTGRDNLSQVLLNGAVKGKYSSVTLASDMRAIIPLPCLLQVADAIISHELLCHIDRIFPPTIGVYIGAVKHTQTLDIASGIRAMYEKAGDDHGRGAAAEGDIASYYDEIQIIKIMRWLLDHDVPVDVAVTVVKLQMLPVVVLRIGNTSVHLSGRAKGVLTGSRTANQIARIPVQQSIVDSWTSIEPLGYAAGPNRLVVATWVDNLYSVAHSSLDAITVVEIIAGRLAEAWSLRIKPSSKKYCPADPNDCVNMPSWVMVDMFEPLGHFVQPNGGVLKAWSKTKSLLWRAFFKKFTSHSFHMLTLDRRLQCMKQHLEPVLTYRCSGWPYQRTLSSLIDKLQARMVAMINPVSRLPNEEDDRFFRRRCHMASTICDKHGRWSHLWAILVVSWDGHLRRNTGGLLWGALLREVRNTNWLQSRRARFLPIFSIQQGSWDIDAGRLGSRRTRGAPPMRWDDGVEAANQVIRAEGLQEKLERLNRRKNQ